MSGFDHPPRPGSAMSDASSTATEKAENSWLDMLSKVTLSRRLPHKSILVLGGTSEGQKEFVESLGAGGHKKGSKAAPIANAFALGYTYQDVLDADHEDVLARLGIYLIKEPSPAFIPLLRPLFTPATLPETMVVILLDWSRPWEWVRQMKTWVRLLRGIFHTLDEDCHLALDEVIRAWDSRRSTYVSDGGGAPGTTTLPDVVLPLGQGEFDEPIGLPLCVVCQNADKIELLEKERGWKEEEFDFVLQFLRTILLKHGASLIYTTPSSPSSLQPLIHNMLSIASPLRSQTLKHNVIDRDKVLVPPHWDSWGKIRVLREGFDVEGINLGWSADIAPSSEPEGSEAGDLEGNGEGGGATEVYEDVIKDTGRQNDHMALLKGRTMEVMPVDTQEFLASQLETLEQKAQEDRGVKGKKGMAGVEEQDGALQEQVGPVQFNVGGIQVDAENMLESLKQREASRAAGDGMPGGTPPPPVDGKSQNEVLSAFFNSLMKKKGTGKPA
ncbi:dynein light intermediate chain-domain-containing protein [Pyronema domesticum]|nr:dynein light intermediate chain-domain-containing protein [Pyronema domesticum]